MHTSHFRHRLVEFWAVGVTFLSLINYTQGVNAINYGSSSYSGSCSYGCAGSSPSTASDTGTSTVSDDSSTTNASSISQSTNTAPSSDSSLTIASVGQAKPIDLDPFTTSAQAQRAIETRNLLRALSIILGSIIIMLMLPGSVFRWILARFGRGDHHDHNRPGGSGTNWGGPYVQEPIPIHRPTVAQATLNSRPLVPITVSVIGQDEDLDPSMMVSELALGLNHQPSLVQSSNKNASDSDPASNSAESID